MSNQYEYILIENRPIYNFSFHCGYRTRISNRERKLETRGIKINSPTVTKHDMLCINANAHMLILDCTYNIEVSLLIQ